MLRFWKSIIKFILIEIKLFINFAGIIKKCGEKMGETPVNKKRNNLKINLLRFINYIFGAQNRTRT